MVATSPDSQPRCYAFTGTAVDADHAERARLIAVTTTRRVEPASAAETVYVDVIAFGIATHAPAVVSVQRCH
jgi:hypothetical protein